MTLNNLLLSLAQDYSNKRCMLPNDHNGHVYMSCVILGKSNSAFYGSGINIYNINKRHTSLHAEVHAVQNLNFTKKNIKVNLFVFRTNKTGRKLMMAKPCVHCLNYINKNLVYKGYKLHRIYYTNEEGNIATVSN